MGCEWEVELRPARSAPFLDFPLITPNPCAAGPLVDFSGDKEDSRVESARLHLFHGGIVPLLAVICGANWWPGGTLRSQPTRQVVHLLGTAALHSLARFLRIGLCLGGFTGGVGTLFQLLGTVTGGADAGRGGRHRRQSCLLLT